MFQPERDHRNDIRKAVKKRGADDVFPLVHLVQGLDKGFVIRTDDKNGKDTHADGDAPIERREVQDGDDGKYKFPQGVYIHKPSVEKLTESLPGLPDPVDRSATVMVLVPFYGQMYHLVILLLEEITAEMEGQRTLHHTGRAMEAPLQKLQPDVTADIDKGIMQHMGGIPLDLAYKPSEQDGVHGIHQVGTDKHGVDKDIFSFFPAGITPGRLQ